MDNKAETLVGSRRDKIACELGILGVADLKWVLPTRISVSKPLHADRVGNIEPMKLVGRIGVCNQRAHPTALPDGVGRKIQYDGKAVPQDIDNMRPHRRAKPGRKAPIILDGLQIIGKQMGRPVIFADKQRCRSRRKAPCKRCLPGSNLAAQKIKGWRMS